MPVHVDAQAVVDWRAEGKVTNVKNQLSCGSCWSFAGTGILESYHAVETGRLVSLSEQQSLDCNANNYGCSGGNAASVWRLALNTPIVAESLYPYKNYKSQCKTFSSGEAYSTSYTKITAYSQSELDFYLNKGPITVGVYATNPYWQLY